MEPTVVIVDDRIFVKIVDGKEIDISVDQLKIGDKFSFYGDSAKLHKLHWGDVNKCVFECAGEIYNNSDDVNYMPVIVL